MITFNRIAVLLCLSILFMLGVNYQGEQDYDYSRVDRLPSSENITKVNFAFLGGFKYNNKSDIPGPVMALDGKMIEISGYILPVDFSDGRVTTFMILKHKMTCCFDVMPRNNEFIFAKSGNDKSIDFIKGAPVTVRGVLHIGKEENVMDGIYTMTVEQLTPNG